jgi:hypothetical protein
MRVFISWSGLLSRSVAEILRLWLRKIIQGIEPFVSSEDIKKGDLWIVELMNQLNNSSIGIICLTKENLKSDWILFEAGALYKKFGISKICTLLINVTPKDFDFPLAAFQATTFVKKDMFKLVMTIYKSLDHPLLTERELEDQFNLCWNDLETQVQTLINGSTFERSEIMSLAEELLIPAILREVKAGEITTVFDWMSIAESKKVLDYKGHLGFIEVTLARIAGKKNAPKNLHDAIKYSNQFKCEALLELLLYNFATDYSIADFQIDLNLVQKSSEATKRTIYTILSIWHLREGNLIDARKYFDLSNPSKITNDANSYYRSIPLGILCFAFNFGDLGEKHFDFARTDLSNEGYPYVSLLSDFDRMFVNVCINQSNKPISESRARDLRGHIWVLVKYLDFFRQNSEALKCLVNCSLAWKTPLNGRSVAERLYQFQRKLAASCGGQPIRY